MKSLFVKKFDKVSSWSRGAAIGSIQRVIASTKCVAISLVLLAFLAACDDSSSASAENNEPTTLSSAEEQGSSSSSSFTSAGSVTLSSSSRHCEECNDEAISSDSNAESNGSSRSSSSEKNAESSSSEKLSETSSSSAGKVDCSTFLEWEKKHDKWNWDVPKECRFNPDIDYGSMTDSRDGQVYRTVKIGSQVWMAENLNYAYTGVKFNYRDDNSDKDYSSDSSSWCYVNTLGNCAGTGRLYTWAAAIDSVKLANDAENPLDCGYGKNCSLPARVQGICPEGWHLPTAAEWDTLFTTVGGQSTAGNILKSQTGWCCDANGDDAYGFSALPVGFRHQSGYFEHFRDHAYFWSGDATLLVEKAGSMSLIAKDEYAHRSGSYKFFAYSVRCVKDSD